MDWFLQKGDVTIWIDKDVAFGEGLFVLIADFTAQACTITITLTSNMT